MQKFKRRSLFPENKVNPHPLAPLANLHANLKRAPKETPLKIVVVLSSIEFALELGERAHPRQFESSSHFPPEGAGHGTREGCGTPAPPGPCLHFRVWEAGFEERPGRPKQLTSAAGQMLQMPPMSLCALRRGVGLASFCRLDIGDRHLSRRQHLVFCFFSQATSARVLQLQVLGGKSLATNFGFFALVTIISDSVV